IAGWCAARRRTFDIGMAFGPWGLTYFVESLGIGLLTDFFSAADSQLDSRGVASIHELWMKSLCRFPPRKLKVSIDGHNFSGDYILLEAMNIRSVGPSLPLAPDAECDDGLLNVVLVEDGERDRLASYFVNRWGNPSELPTLLIRKGRH